MTDNTKDPIDELRRLYEAATGVEWFQDGPLHVMGTRKRRSMVADLVGCSVQSDASPEATCQADAAFIVYSHNITPALCDYVRAHEEVERALRRYIRGQQNRVGPLAGMIDRDAIVAALRDLDAAREKLRGAK